MKNRLKQYIRISVWFVRKKIWKINSSGNDLKIYFIERKILKNVFFEREILKNVFLRKQMWEMYFSGTNSKNLLKAILRNT